MIYAECFSCFQRLNNPKAARQWYWIAGANTGYPSFCSWGCLADYADKQREKNS